MDEEREKLKSQAEGRKGIVKRVHNNPLSIPPQPHQNEGCPSLGSSRGNKRREFRTRKIAREKSEGGQQDQELGGKGEFGETGT